MAAAESFHGSLLTRHFVAHVLATAFAGQLGEASMAAARRRCIRWRREAHARLGPASSVRAICEVGAAPLFAQAGFVTVRQVRLDAGGTRALAQPARGRTETQSDVLIAVLEGTDGVTVRLVVSPWQERLDRLWRAALQSSAEAKQRWCVCFNGHQLRVVDAARPYARRFLEFDLRYALEDDRGFQLLWAVMRAHAFITWPSMPALLDRIVEACDAHGGSVREALQHGVRTALSTLATAMARADRRTARRQAMTRRGDAVGDASGVISEGASISAPASAAEVVGQALTMIYRLLFLLFAEARALVPVWHPVYRDSYSIGKLHALAGRRGTRGLWAAVQAISRLAHDGCVVDDLSVTAFNGQLFAPEHTPLGERLHVAGPIIADVLDALMTTAAHAGRGRERITYADLGVEQLGTVYERVLDYAPHLERELGSATGPAIPETINRRPASLRSSARRKESGSFYTPRSMAEYLVRVTLGPLVAEASADEILSLRVLDPAMGSGAFLVSACRFLARAHDRAREREGAAPPSTDAAGAQAHAEVRRHIARHCLFGVDLNPMAVQLARLSVWLTTMRRHAPLTFLDHHLRVGDSLVGASLDDLARRPPASGRTPRMRTAAELPLFAGPEHAHLMRAILPARAALTATDDSASTVREKERLLRSLARESALAGWLQLADAWCASWFPGDDTPAPAAAWPAIVDYTLHGRAALPQPTLDAWLATIRATASRRRFFHWTLEFPEAFFDRDGQPLPNGGFDAIVGNPPWDMIRNDAHDDLAPVPGTDRMERETRALSRFVRESGLYPSTGDAHFNCYQLFVERSLALLKRGGRFGLVLPWGIAADHGSARLRRRLLESCDIDTLVGFENNRAIFPIHRSTRFALTIGTAGRPTRAVRCRLGERDPAVLDALDGRGSLTVTVDLLRRVSGEGLAFPDAREPMDIVILERLHTAHPSLASPDGWHARFGRELNASDDDPLLEDQRTSRETRVGTGDSTQPQARIPVVDGKHLCPFDVSLSGTTHVVRSEASLGLRGRLPDIGRERLAFRDIASPTNRLTLIAALLPADVVSTHTISCLKSPLPPNAQWCLCALLNSFVANYLMRMRVSTHVTLALMARLPVPKPFEGSALFQQLANLAYLCHRRARAGADATRGKDYERLQALAAQAYDLSDKEFRHVLTKFPRIDEETRLAALDLFRTFRA